MLIRGRLIDISSSSLCAYLGAPNVPQEPLGNFIVRPTYRELQHTLCGVNSIVAWVCDKKIHRHRKFPKKKMKLEAQVRLKLINARLLSCNDDTFIGLERVILLYFLMTGQKVNVVCLIRHQMVHV